MNDGFLRPVPCSSMANIAPRHDIEDGCDPSDASHWGSAQCLAQLYFNDGIIRPRPCHSTLYLASRKFAEQSDTRSMTDAIRPGECLAQHNIAQRNNTKSTRETIPPLPFPSTPCSCPAAPCHTTSQRRLMPSFATAAFAPPDSASQWQIDDGRCPSRGVLCSALPRAA